MVTNGEYVTHRRALWHEHPCPFCGKATYPDWLLLLSTYTLQCHWCNEVVESFELYRSKYGDLIVENHLLAIRAEVEGKPPTYERVAD